MLDVKKMPKFGVARKYLKDIIKYIDMLNENQIEAYEMGFAYGIPSNFPEETIESSIKSNVHLTGHLPFWINLGNSNDDKNLNYLVSGLKVAEELKSVCVFHLGFYGNKKFDDLKTNIVELIQKALEISNVNNGKIGIETTGKQEAIGTLDEIIELINLINDERVIPIIDWAHLYARSNGVYPYDYQDFKEILQKIVENIGYKPYYFHFGGITYKKGNEIKHMSVKSFEPPAPNLFAALKDLNFNDFTMIIESPDSIEDVKWLKQVFANPENYFNEIPSKKTKTLFDF